MKLETFFCMVIGHRYEAKNVVYSYQSKYSNNVPTSSVTFVCERCRNTKFQLFNCKDMTIEQANNIGCK